MDPGRTLASCPSMPLETSRDAHRPGVISVVVYGYRCGECGDLEARFPLGSAPATYECPHCRSTASRNYRAVHLTPSAPPALAAARNREQACRDNPEVVRVRR